jgi:hypothetical protein
MASRSPAGEQGPHVVELIRANGLDVNLSHERQRTQIATP